MNFIKDPKVFIKNDLMKWVYSFAGLIFISKHYNA
jgi:hypothetical protein